MRPHSTTPTIDHLGSGLNADVVINLPALGGGVDPFDGVAYVFGGITCSYDQAPAGGRLTIENGAGNVVFDIDVTSDGPREFKFQPNFRGTKNTALIITLFAGGAGVTGKLNVIGLHTQG